MIRIDGSYGEGGGQILRYAACFAAATSEKVEVYNIRAKRPNPGLRPQHLAVLNIMQRIFGGQVINAKVGSTRVIFEFGSSIADKVAYNVGTAGSVTLILQSIVPAIAARKARLDIRLIGGTDVKWSPTTDYMNYAYRTLAQKFGVDLSLKVVRRGYYPKGGGIIDVHIETHGLRSLSIVKKGKVDKVVIRSVVSNLPRHISTRQINKAKEIISEAGLENLIEVEEELPGPSGAMGPGVSLLVVGRNSEYKIFSGGDSIGEKGKPAEEVGREAADRFLEWYNSGAAIDIFQSDMIIPYIAFAGGGEYTAPRYTAHMESALYVMKEVLGLNYEVTKLNDIYNIKIF